MLIIGLNGSPNGQGNTDFLLRLAIKELEGRGAKTGVENLGEIMIAQKRPFCLACSSPCNKSCFLGSSLEESLARLAQADAIIMASPVYFGTVSAQLKAYWDKTRSLRADKVLIGRLGAAISVGGSKFGGQETTIGTMHDMMLIHGMKIVGPGSKDFDAGHQGVCAVKPATEDAYAINRAKILGARIFEELSGAHHGS